MVPASTSAMLWKEMLYALVCLDILSWLMGFLVKVSDYVSPQRCD